MRPDRATFLAPGTEMALVGPGRRHPQITRLGFGPELAKLGPDMGLARILVDGFSLLHSWPELAPGKPRHSASARGELIRRMTQYYDACGTPITIVFDGAGPSAGADETVSTPEVEILYSQSGQTADQIIERAAFRLKQYGEVLVVTDDVAERETVAGFGVMTSSCENFIGTIKSDLAGLERELQDHNRRERNRFRTP